MVFSSVYGSLSYIHHTCKNKNDKNKKNDNELNMWVLILSHAGAEGSRFAQLDWQHFFFLKGRILIMF